MVVEVGILVFACVGSGMCAKSEDEQLRHERQLQAHSITVEASNSGGYQVVE